MHFMVILSKELKGNFYFSMDNDTNDLIIINGRDGSYQRYDIELVKKYLSNPSDFVKFVV